jgi:hypothetical protein
MEQKFALQKLREENNLFGPGDFCEIETVSTSVEQLSNS